MMCLFLLELCRGIQRLVLCQSEKDQANMPIHSVWLDLNHYILKLLICMGYIKQSDNKNELYFSVCFFFFFFLSLQNVGHGISCELSP